MSDDNIDKKRVKKGFLKKALYTGLLAGTLGCSGAMYGLDGVLNAMAFPAGEAIARKIEKRPMSIEDAVKQAIVGTAMTPVFQYGWKQMEKYVPVERLSNVYNKTGSIGKTADYFASHSGEYLARTATIAGGFLPPVVAVNQALDYAIEKKSVRGMYSHMKENLWKSVKKVSYQVAPLVALNTFIVPAGLNVAAGSLISAAYRVAMALSQRKYNAK